MKEFKMWDGGRACVSSSSSELGRSPRLAAETNGSDTYLAKVKLHTLDWHSALGWLPALAAGYMG